MPGFIDPQTINADGLPAIWSPVQWELTEDERQEELEAQATASLLQVADLPEALLRMLLDETAIVRAFDPPPGYDPEMQGEWDPDLVTFEFARDFELRQVKRNSDSFYAEYKVEDLGYWAVEIKPEGLQIYRL